MIPEPVLIILAAGSVGLVIALCEWVATRASRRRCIEMRAMAELHLATLHAFTATPAKPGADLSQKIVPFRRPDPTRA